MVAPVGSVSAAFGEVRILASLARGKPAAEGLLILRPESLPLAAAPK